MPGQEENRLVQLESSYKVNQELQASDPGGDPDWQGLSHNHPWRQDHMVVQPEFRNYNAFTTWMEPFPSQPGVDFKAKPPDAFHTVCCVHNQLLTLPDGCVPFKHEAN